jgi:hypothetical protein
MVMTTITETDLSVRVYGPEDKTYSFIWNAKFTDSKTILIDTSFSTPLLGGKQEEVVVEFVSYSNFKSQYSQRSINHETELSGYLNQEGEQTSAKALGQSAMIIIFISVGITAISSFGNNSMEMMWGLMNTLQILYFISYIHVVFPDHLDTFFEYLKFANADNEYLKQLSFLIISDDNFSQDEVNGKFGEMSFYLNSADKIPGLIF